MGKVKRVKIVGERESGWRNERRVSNEVAPILHSRII